MTTQATGRQCGNCGAAVPADAVTCPACDALLAAYEAPSGSDEADLTPTLTSFDSRPVTPAPELSRIHPDSDPVLPSSPEPVSTAFSADAALDEARRTLGMAPSAEPVLSRQDPAPEPALPEVPGPSGNSSGVDESLDEARSALHRVMASKANIAETSPAVPQQLQRRGRKLGPPPARPLPRPTPEPSGRAGMAQQPALTPEPPIASVPIPESQPGVTPDAPARTRDHPVLTIAHLAFLGIFAFLFLSIVRSFPFGVSPFIMIIFAIVILSHLMRIVAGATGRKTTTMRDPNSRNGWKR